MLLGCISCKKESILEIKKPSNPVYSISNIVGFTSVSDSSLTPTIQWNNEIGYFYFVNGKKTGLYIHPKTGKIFWNQYLLPGVYKVGVQAINSAGKSDIIDLQIEIRGVVPGKIAYAIDTMIIPYQQEVTGMLTSVAPKISWYGKAGTFFINDTKGLAGIDIDSISGIISCRKNLNKGEYIVTIKAKNEVGISDGVNYQISVGTISSPLIFMPDSFSTPWGISRVSHKPIFAENGGVKLFFSLIKNATPGISINSSTGEILIADSVAVGVYPLNVNAKNIFGNVNGVIKVYITTKLSNTLTYNPTKLKIDQGNQISVLPSATIGLNNVKYVIANNPPEITIDENTGAILTNRNLAIGSHSFRVTVNHSITGQSASADCVLQVNVASPSSLAYTPNTYTDTFGSAGISSQPSIIAGDGTAVSYLMSGNPTGVNINSSTGVISWTNAVAIGNYNLTITPKNSIGEGATAIVNLSIVPQLPKIDYRDSLNYLIEPFAKAISWLGAF